MGIEHNGYHYIFRECDVRGWTQEQVQELADKTGKMQYEQNHAWLIIPGIGYGMEVQ